MTSAIANSRPPDFIRAVELSLVDAIVKFFGKTRFRPASNCRTPVAVLTSVDHGATIESVFDDRPPFECLAMRCSRQWWCGVP